MTRFTGWPEEAFDVLVALEGEPSMAERERHRAHREEWVRQPMVALLADLAACDPAYEDHAVWHYRKSIGAWQRQSAAIRIGQHIELGVSFDLDGPAVQGAWWYPLRGQVPKYRAAVADETTGTELAGIVDHLRATGFEISGDLTVKVPRGYPPDHPRAQLLRHRSMIAAIPLGCDPWVHTPEALDRVREACDRLRPLMSWLIDQVTIDEHEP